MQVRVRVRGSPYTAVQPGRVATVISRERISTSSERVTVQFENGVTWVFHPDEVERLDGQPL